MRSTTTIADLPTEVIGLVGTFLNASSRRNCTEASKLFRHISAEQTRHVLECDQSSITTKLLTDFDTRFRRLLERSPRLRRFDIKIKEVYALDFVLPSSFFVVSPELLATVDVSVDVIDCADTDSVLRILPRRGLARLRVELCHEAQDSEDEEEQEQDQPHMCGTTLPTATSIPEDCGAVRMVMRTCHFRHLATDTELLRKVSALCVIVPRRDRPTEHLPIDLGRIDPEATREVKIVILDSFARSVPLVGDAAHKVTHLSTVNLDRMCLEDLAHRLFPSTRLRTVVFTEGDTYPNTCFWCELVEAKKDGGSESESRPAWALFPAGARIVVIPNTARCFSYLLRLHVACLRSRQSTQSTQSIHLGCVDAFDLAFCRLVNRIFSCMAQTDVATPDLLDIEFVPECAAPQHNMYMLDYDDEVRSRLVVPAYTEQQRMPQELGRCFLEDLTPAQQTEVHGHLFLYCMMFKMRTAHVFRCRQLQLQCDRLQAALKSFSSFNT